jgi:hypothetical protein
LIDKNLIENSKRVFKIGIKSAITLLTIHQFI